MFPSWNLGIFDRKTWGSAPQDGTPEEIHPPDFIKGAAPAAPSDGSISAAQHGTRMTSERYGYESG
jgi:hypothetical protein